MTEKTQTQDSLTISDAGSMQVTDMTPVGGVMVPDTRQGGGALENYHEDFDGLGASPYPEYVSIDGESFQYKKQDKRVPKLEIRLIGGRAVWQYYDEDEKVFYKSYNNVTLDDGTPINNSVAAGKMRHCFELEWLEQDDGADEPSKKQFIAAPTSRHMFETYADALKKKCNLRIRDVVTIVTVMRDQNKSGMKFGKAAFTCAELTAAGWTPPQPRR